MFKFRREWQRTLHEAGYAGLSWPKEYGGRGATLIEQAIFNEEMARARRPRHGQRARPRDGRPGGDRPRHRRAEAALPHADPLGRGDLVPGLLRAGVGLGPRLAEDEGGEVERRLEDHRPEGLDHLRARGQVVHARRAHRPGRAQAQGAHLLPDGHGAGGGAGAPARPDHGRVRVQRDLHGGGLRPRRERRRRARPGLERGHHDADERARRAGVRLRGGDQARARRPDGAGARARPGGRPGDPPACGPALHRGRDAAARTPIAGSRAR